MAQSVLEQVGEKAAEAAQKTSRAASAVADAVEDGLASARHAAKQGGYASAELLADTKKRVQRHPIEAIAAAFTAGIVAGSAIRWMLNRRQC